MILDGSYVGVITQAKYTVDCAVALGAPLGFGRATEFYGGQECKLSLAVAAVHA